jgi:hypothetical protein
MPKTLNLLDRLACWQIVAALAVPAVSIMLLFNFHPAGVPRLLEFGGGVRPLDAQLGYGPGDVYSLLTKYGGEGRRHYALFLAVDMVYAVSYGLFLAGLLRIVLRALGIRAGSSWNYLCVLPIAAGSADCIENASFLVLLAAYPDVPLAVVYIASAATALKWLLAAVSILLILAGSSVLLFRLVRRARRGGSN